MEYVFPYPILNADSSFGRTRGDYADGLTTTAYNTGDLVTINADGEVVKVVATTAAALSAMGFASGPYDLSPMDSDRYSYYKDRGVPVDTMRKGQLVCFTYQGATANTANHVFAAADLEAVKAQESRQLLYNGTEGVLSVRAATGTPGVKMIRVVEGEVGDENVVVACEILDAYRLGG